MRSKIFEASETFWEQEMSIKILSFVRDELYMELRFMGIALGALVPEKKDSITTVATDGEYLFFSTEQILRLFKKNPKYIDRIYLHSVFHCIFSHLWIRKQKEVYIWNIACDIAVEYTIDHLDLKCTKRILSFVRKKIYDDLEKKQIKIAAASIYIYLKDKDIEELQKLKSEFFADDHVFWPKEENENVNTKSVKKKWDKISRQTVMEQKKKGDDPKEGEKLMSLQMKVQKSRRSYREFLQKFSVLREEMHCDMDEFDLNYYTYGLKLYKNMPLIEPLESREIKKISDFVIVVDTSYSTSGELIENFLRETFKILKMQESFFSSCRVHVIQCDEHVRKDTVIQNENELDRLFHKFEIVGGGGTDFRPAFLYVNNLIEEGTFDNLCGLIYFTDGKGIYPEKKPDYKTAFLFLEDFDEEKVPFWAMRMRLEDFDEYKGK